MSVEQLEALNSTFVTLGGVGAVMTAAGLGFLFIPRVVEAWRVVSEAQKDTSPGVHRVNPQAWEDAEFAAIVRDLEEGAR